MTSRRFPTHVRSLTAFAIALVIGASGCQRRAFTELYVENMASEIRTLEDIVYEYDAEYRAMERELEDLRRINEQLESKLQDSEQVLRESRTKPRPLLPENNLPEKETPPGILPEPSVPKSAPLRLPSKVEEMELEAPEVIVPKVPPRTPLPEPLPPDAGVKPSQWTEPIVDTSPSTAPNTAPLGLPHEVTDASLDRRRIVAPVLPQVQRASAQVPVTQGPATTAATPTDLRVREIEFHPSLCRGHNLDGKPGDDGLYLVLVPRNTEQQFVPNVGALTIVAEETDASGETSRIGRWEFRPDELKDWMEPIGNGQGFHIQLAWDQVVPKGTVIDVYARFMADDGTMMVNRKQIHLRKPTPGQSMWTPR